MRAWLRRARGIRGRLGINFAHQGDVVFASWFTYDATGRAWWLTMTADKVADGVYAGALYETRGPAFSSVPFDATAVKAAAVGNGTLTFADADHATFHYVVNGVAKRRPDEARDAPGLQVARHDLHGGPVIAARPVR